MYIGYIKTVFGLIRADCRKMLLSMLLGRKSMLMGCVQLQCDMGMNAAADEFGRESALMDMNRDGGTLCCRSDRSSVKKGEGTLSDEIAMLNEF